MIFFNSKSILDSKRYVWIDSDKGISIILVGYGHCLAQLNEHGALLNPHSIFNYIGVFLYGFRMPLFFFISGVFIQSSLTRKKLSGYVKDRAYIVLYPLIIWGVIEISLNFIVGHFRGEAMNPILYVNLIYDPRTLGHFWYLNALFSISVIYAYIKSKLGVKPIFQCLLGLILFTTAALIRRYNIDGRFLTDICEFYIFFAIGDLISNTVLSPSFAKKFASFKVFFPLLLVFICTQYIFAKLNLHGGADGINYVEHRLPVFYLFEALLGCTISINFSFLLQKYNKLRFLRVVGFHSLFTYCMQIIVMTFVRLFLVSGLKITYPPILILIIWPAGIIIPMIFYNFCQRVNLWWLFTFKKPNKITKFEIVNA